MIKVDGLSVGPLQSNCYILYNNDNEAVVIDPGDDFDKIDNHIVQKNFNVEAIIFTHGHFDHIGAGELLYDKYLCKVYVHADDAQMLSDSYLNLSSRMSMTEAVFEKDFISVVDETVTLLGSEFTFIHTPGHTPGSMCIMCDDMLFTGDTLFKLSVGNSFSPYGDINTEIKSIVEKIYTLPNLTCYPGHGEPTAIEYEKNYNPYTKQGEMWI